GQTVSNDRDVSGNKGQIDYSMVKIDCLEWQIVYSKSEASHRMKSLSNIGSYCFENKSLF
ncbi:hypothetical protein, partial [Mesotoga prima]|uniref:hypothetical protein n=1 Tax=Mesotoga prima TaxID=1184387 RepID=UPI002FDAEC96